MILLISDLHLQEERPDITRAFLDLLDGRARHAKALYILGDFFEAWIGDDAMTPFQQSICQALRRLSDDGLVDSSWEEPVTGPARRRYWVTPAGAASLDDCTSSVVATSRSLGAFLARRRRLAGQGMAKAANG